MKLGRVIAGKYCLLHELGRGGMGSVWAAEHLDLRTQVAVKLIEPHVLESPHVRERFEREARALATLRSGNIVQVLDYGVDGGTQYLVMELLRGRTLRAALQAGFRLEPHEVWTIAQQVSRAMTVTHAAGFIHRDLKPENIFLVDNGDDEAPNVKVLDFGISKTLDARAVPLTTTGGLVGTCEYMSPEQVVGQEVDSRSDLWSLGVVVFESLIGLSPFRASSAAASLFAICHGPTLVPSAVARVPPGFDAWFARAVQRDPERRFQTARQLADSLRPTLDVPRDWFGGGAPELPDEERTLRVDVSDTAPLERRVDARVSSSIPAAIGGRRDMRNTALIYNTSRSGALLATRRSWQEEQSIALTLHLDSAYEGETVHAQVVRVSARDTPLWKFEVAVRFKEPLSDELLGRIEARARR